MLVAGVVDDQIHHQLHAAVMYALQHLFEGLHAAEFRGDIHVIGDVIAAVRAGGGVNGGEPDTVASQGLDVVQLFQHAPEIAHAISVAVLEAAGPDLIEHHVLVPAAAFHADSSKET